MAAILECQTANNEAASCKEHSDTKLYDSLEIFFVHILLLLVTEAILICLFLFLFETIQCKNHSDTNLIKIHSAVIEILSFLCYF